METLMLASAGLSEAKDRRGHEGKSQRQSGTHRALSQTHYSSAEHIYRMLSGMVARRFRFLHPCVLHSSVELTFSQQYFVDCRSGVLDFGDAAGWRVFIRDDGGSLGTPPDADAQHHRVFVL